MLKVKPCPFRLPRQVKSLNVPRKFGCLMAVIPDPVAKQITDWAKSIPDVNLGVGGRESVPHVTVKYGFKDSSSKVIQGLRSLLARHGPFTVKLKSLSLFTDNEDGDVLKIEIESKDLKTLNKLVSQNFDCEDKYPKYNPHLTVAYLDPKVSEYHTRRECSFLDQECEISVMEYSGVDGHKELIPLSFAQLDKALSAYGELSGGTLVGSKPKTSYLGHKPITPYRIKGQPPGNTPQAQAYTGKMEDKLGRTRCYSQGVLVPCGQIGETEGASNNQNQQQGQKPQQGQESPEQQKREQTQAVEHALMQVAHKAPKNWYGRIVKRLTNGVYKKLSSVKRRRIKKFIAFGMAMEHTVASVASATSHMAYEITKELGYDEKSAKRVQKWTNIFDVSYGWTTKMFHAHHGLEALGVGSKTALAGSKLSYYVPVASAAYVVSAALESVVKGDPLATWRAAKKAVGKAAGELKHSWGEWVGSTFGENRRGAGAKLGTSQEGKALEQAEEEKSNISEEDIETLAHFLNEAEQQGQEDMAMACLAVAIDSGAGTLSEAVKVAQTALATEPEDERDLEAPQIKSLIPSRCGSVLSYRAKCQEGPNKGKPGVCPGENHERTEPRGDERTGSEGPGEESPEYSREVEKETPGSENTTTTEVREPKVESTARKTAECVPAEIGEVNKRIDRFERFFRSKGQHNVADWMGMLKDHINAVGGEEALKALGEEFSSDNKDTVQYWGVGTEENNWKNMGDFIEAYLARNGIIAVTGDTSDPDLPLVSALGKPDKYLAGDFKPSDMYYKDKLSEAKDLPGLETSEDISKIVGKEVTHLTKEVTDKLNEKYGEGQWIVKCYDDNAAAGYGIFFPQRAQKVMQDAKSVIWDSGGPLAKYGFTHLRDEDGDIVGIKHQGGDEYHFGTDEYDQKIRGDARQWGDRVAAAAQSENGAILPEGSFMVQPAFKAVGISDAERAAGKTWHEKNEGRVHLVTRPNGKVEVIPHSTWLKGGNLPVVFEDDDTRAMAKAAQDAINALPLEARKGQVYAPDIMKTADGYRVVELNAQGDHNGSGYLHDNHFTIDSYTSYLTGREPAHVQFIRKLLRKNKKTSIPQAPKVEEKRLVFSRCKSIDDYFQKKISGAKPKQPTEKTHAGEPCKPGWSAARTGCIPKKKPTPGQKPQPKGAKPKPEPKAKKEKIPRPKATRKPSADEGREAIKKVNEGGLTPDKLENLLGFLSTMGIADLRTLQKEANAKAGRSIKELAENIKKAVGGGKAPDKVEPPPKKEEIKPVAPEAKKGGVPPPSPGFNGRDTLGRMWKNGELQEGDIEEASTEIGKRIQSNKETMELVNKLASLPSRDDLAQESLEIARKAGKLSTKLALVDPRTKEGKRQINTIIKEQDTIRKQSWAAHDASLRAESAARAKAKEMLTLPEGKRANVSVQDMAANVPEDTKQQFGKALEWLSGIVAKGEDGADLPAYNVRAATGGYRSNYRGEINTVEMDTVSRGDVTCVHEMAHGIEQKLPGALKACADFLEHRIKGEQPSQLNKVIQGTGYQDNEYGVKDNFDKAFGERNAWYVGKSYKRGGSYDATEILSMGVEQLYADPTGFARKDPEYCAFVVGILNGSTRDKPPLSDDEDYFDDFGNL